MTNFKEVPCVDIKILWNSKLCLQTVCGSVGWCLIELV